MDIDPVKAMELVREAIKDCQAGILPERSFFYAIAAIVMPQKITDADIAWGKKAIAEMDARKEKNPPPVCRKMVV